MKAPATAMDGVVNGHVPNNAKAPPVPSRAPAMGGAQDRLSVAARRVGYAKQDMELTQSPGFLLWRTTLRWQRLMTAALRPFNLTHVQFVLLASTWWLTRVAGETPNQRRLAEHAGTDAMMTSQVVRAWRPRSW